MKVQVRKERIIVVLAKLNQFWQIPERKIKLCNYTSFGSRNAEIYGFTNDEPKLDLNCTV